MSYQRKRTFCGICEAICGVEIVVDNGRVTSIEPDRNHPVSRGFICTKGVNYTDILYDPERVTAPLVRRADGTGFDEISWDEALDGIAERMKQIIAKHGRHAIGSYIGNAAANNPGAFFWAKGFIDALGSNHTYTAASVDVYSRWAASAMLYGSPLVNPIPDLDRTDFVLMIGANPVVSHGSMVTAPRFRDRLVAITKAGGRVVVVDPRRSETARLFEHVAIRPGGDAWLLASMLHVIDGEGLVDQAAVDAQSVGMGQVWNLVRRLPPEATESRTGLEPEFVRTLARDFATAEKAAVYGRCGASLGHFSTLVFYLHDALAVATGNLDRPGGCVFGHSPWELEKVTHLAKQATFATWRSRTSDLPEIMGESHSIDMLSEIRTPGDGQLRALFTVAGNPAISLPGGEELQTALAELDLLVSLDIYQTDTARLADYILPCATWVERDGLPWFPGMNMLQTHVQWTEPSVAPPPGCREEWWILDQIARRIGIYPSSFPIARFLGKLGLRLNVQQTIDMLIRTGPFGDKFGLRRKGLNRRKLWANPAGFLMEAHPPTPTLRDHLFNKAKKIQFDHPAIRPDIERFLAAPEQPADLPLQCISLRELRSQNTYLHNSERLVRKRPQQLRMNTVDATARGISSGDLVVVRSKDGAIELPVLVSDDEMRPGAVAIPHGWGHSGGWSTAVAAGGVNFNIISPRSAADADQASGNAVLNGFPVEVTLSVAAVSDK